MADDQTPTNSPRLDENRDRTYQMELDFMRYEREYNRQHYLSYGVHRDAFFAGVITAGLEMLALSDYLPKIQERLSIGVALVPLVGMVAGAAVWYMGVTLYHTATHLEHPASQERQQPSGQ